MLREKAGEPISRCLLRSEGKEFRVTHAANADLLEISLGAPGETSMRQLMPAGKNDPVALFNEELARGGRAAFTCAHSKACAISFRDLLTVVSQSRSLRSAG